MRENEKHTTSEAADRHKHRHGDHKHRQKSRNSETEENQEHRSSRPRQSPRIKSTKEDSKVQRKISHDQLRNGLLGFKGNKSPKNQKDNANHTVRTKSDPINVVFLDDTSVDTRYRSLKKRKHHNNSNRLSADGVRTRAYSKSPVGRLNRDEDSNTGGTNTPREMLFSDLELNNDKDTEMSPKEDSVLMGLAKKTYLGKMIQKEIRRKKSNVEAPPSDGKDLLASEPAKENLDTSKAVNKKRERRKRDDNERLAWDGKEPLPAEVLDSGKEQYNVDRLAQKKVHPLLQPDSQNKGNRSSSTNNEPDGVDFKNEEKKKRREASPRNSTKETMNKQGGVNKKDERRKHDAIIDRLAWDGEEPLPAEVLDSGKEQYTADRIAQMKVHPFLQPHFAVLQPDSENKGNRPSSTSNEPDGVGFKYEEKKKRKEASPRNSTRESKNKQGGVNKKDERRKHDAIIDRLTNEEAFQSQESGEEQYNADVLAKQKIHPFLKPHFVMLRPGSQNKENRPSSTGGELDGFDYKKEERKKRKEALGKHSSSQDSLLSSRKKYLSPDTENRFGSEGGVRTPKPTRRRSSCFPMSEQDRQGLDDIRHESIRDEFTAFFPVPSVDRTCKDLAQDMKEVDLDNVIKDFNRQPILKPLRRNVIAPARANAGRRNPVKCLAARTDHDTYYVEQEGQAGSR